MIPDFNENGELPRGIHKANLEEIEERFCNNFIRKQIFNGFLLLLKEFEKIDCKEIYIDGSFTTIKELPDDIDVCWGNTETATTEYFKYVKKVAPDLHFTIDYFLKCHIQPAYYKVYNEENVEIFFIDFFQTSKKDNTSKGIIKLIL